ncbi:MAG: glycosyltransferase family 4 protein [Xenococcaceae cyanobacterium]
MPADNHKPKVSLVVSDLSSSGAGRWGGGVRPFLLAQALRKLDYRVEMVGVAFGEKSQAIADSKIPISAFPCEYHSGFLSAASQAIEKIDGDIIYAVKLKPTSFGIALVKKFLSHRPLMLDIDDWELSWYGGEKWQYRPGVKQFFRDVFTAEGALKHPDHPLYLKWIENLYSRADVITIHNQFLQNRFGGIYIPNGKDTDLFNPANYDYRASRVKYDLVDYKILMFPGAPRPYKGVEDVLIALDILGQSDLRLAIVGGSPYDDYDRQLKEKWGKWIIQLPPSPVALMPEIVAAADIIVVPQRNTPAAQAQFPLKLTDGMAMAKPILATEVGDIPQILGDTGYLVPPSRPEQIAHAIQDIFADLDRAKTKGIEARKRCIQYYSIETMAQILDRTMTKLNLK